VSTVYHAGQQRSKDIAKIENDITEISDLFQEVGDAVIAQESKIIAVEEASGETSRDVEKANQDLGIAVDHAIIRRRNHKRVIVLTVIIMLIIAVVLAVVFK
jgi:syntaxin 1B/2/3